MSATLRSLPEQSAQPWLGEQERDRLSRITSAPRRRQFMAGRWLARHCLADMFGGDWRGCELSAPDEGRPEVVARLEGWPRAAFFSISHSADWLACAVSTFPVGVDIEDTSRARDVDALIEVTCSDAERRQMSRLSARDSRQAFHARWSLKEAWIKQSGQAFPGMDRIPFEPREPGQPCDAVVLRGNDFVAAVMPATPTSLHLHVLHGLRADTLEMSAWLHNAAGA